MKVLSSLVLLCFALIWCGFMAFADTHAARALSRQLRAAHFPTTTGQVIGSEVKSRYRSKGQRSWRAEVRYAYVVDGGEWTSDRVSPGRFTIGSGRTQAERTVRELPVGREVTVVYDPASPGEAMLKVGLQPEHLLIALLMLPHHLIGIGLLFGTVVPLWRLARGVPRVALRPLDDLRMVVRMPWMSPLWVGIITLGLAGFVGIFVGLFAMSQSPHVATLTAVWLAVLVATAFMVLRQKARINSGIADLVVDAGERTVTLPLSEGRKERVTLPFTDICGVAVRAQPSVTRTTKRGWTVTTTAKPGTFYLALLDKNESPTKVVTSSDVEMLREIAGSLSRTFGWPLS